MSAEPPRYIVFDSGWGGLSIVKAARALGLGGRLVYVADHAGFPYGARSEGDVANRVMASIAAALDAQDAPPEAIVIACNTASTLALPLLRAKWDIPFVGTVPAIKPAAALTRSGLISVLATPETVRRDYTKALIDEFAADRQVTLVGARRLAEIAEAMLESGAEEAEAPPSVKAAIAEEIAPAFVERDGARTDVVVLACTHFPLIGDRLAAAAPWPATWIDPAEAIARRLSNVAPGLGAAEEGAAPPGEIWSTGSPAIGDRLARRLEDLGLTGPARRLALA